METERVRFKIKLDAPELEWLRDAADRAQGNLILEQALSQYLSRMVVSAMADRRFRESLLDGADAAKASAKRERIEKLRAELAKLEPE
ncbi:hypothetical protein IRZ59_20615 [Pseudomonas guariconensis]|uniref:hypothetical protein n=1 Tax=Pseudomonas guariconensis TaxID=1288410 RepID=UPI0018AB4A2F|nr:hypothetical protein [Pseudomonas guariconensis]MBF8732839.1 hypothetical protein [Pseudomonas guariconensis]